MCGIVGMLDFNSDMIDLNSLRNMTKALVHRGPDDQGMHLISFREKITKAVGSDCCHGAVKGFDSAFGFRRLSIQDLSGAGHQPMLHPSGDVLIVFNGEIYNVADLRTELIADGVALRGHSDTEVLLHLYYKYGIPNVLHRLVGMFAFAIADLRFQALYIVRDRLGIKPMYWTTIGNTFLFSSEMKAFLFCSKFQPTVRVDSIDEFLLYRFCSEDRTLLNDVHQILPGYWLQVKRDGIFHKRYWDIPDVVDKRNLSLARAVSEIDELLGECIGNHLVSDVKIGCQLSGGIDSSLITSYAKEQSNADLDSFSVIFKDNIYSEDRWISEAALATDVDSHRFVLSQDYFLNNLERAAWFMDQPFNLPNSIGIYYLSEKAKRHASVLLSGEGADELFGGYSRYCFANIRPSVRPFLPFLVKAPRFGRAFLNAFNDPSEGDLASWFVKHVAFTNENRVRQIRPDAELASIVQRRIEQFNRSTARSMVDRCLKYDMSTYMVDLLMRQDRMTMAHSIENRVPFLDHRVVEFVRALPTDLLVGSGLCFNNIIMRNTKIVLKALASRKFSSEFVYRMKGGFSMPLKEYYKDKQFIALMQDQILPNIRNRGWVDADIVERWWRNCDSEIASNFLVLEQIWSVISLELWAHQFVDRRVPSGL